ncbi:MAG TPA: hypothetical protein VMG60_14710 [Burkholderiaceae bacterium]|nr:hypothetical protein [Burkholderiaceae bacterium]
MTSPKKKVAQKQEELRARLWPDLDLKTLWSRKERHGFATLPRTMPLIMEIMDGLSKGKPISSTYLELWCRAFDEAVVSLSKPDELAFHAGFTGPRAIATWRQRLQILHELGFIRIASGTGGEYSFALVLKP